MKKRSNRNNKIVMNACERCGGAAYQEDPQEDEWRCLQCARSVPAPSAAARRPIALSVA